MTRTAADKRNNRPEMAGFVFGGHIRVRFGGGQPDIGTCTREGALRLRSGQAVCHKGLLQPAYVRAPFDFAQGRLCATSSAYSTAIRSISTRTSLGRRAAST